MATLYRPKILTYTLPGGAYRTPDGQRVTRKTPGAVRIATRSKTWYGRYTDGAGQQHQVKLSACKETARRMLAQLAGVVIVDPFADHCARPLLAHLEDYRRFLTGRGSTAAHVDRQFTRCRKIISGCHWTSLGDLEAAAVVDFLEDLRARVVQLPLLEKGKDSFTGRQPAAALGRHRVTIIRMLRRLGLSGQGNGKARRYSRSEAEALQAELSSGIGATTRNHYLHAVKGFTRWLARERRIAADPLAYLTGQNPDADVRHPRRALPEALFTRFVEVAGAGTTFHGLTGPDRLVLYRLTANTGLRANELASLTPASFDLGAQPPTVTIQAANSKHRHKDVQPLRPDVAGMMRQYLAGKPKGQPVWPGRRSADGAEIIRYDLRAAGIPYRDDDGRYFDFHALRGQFISLLAAAGVHPKVAQVSARHSTISLTMGYYTHLDVFDVAGAPDKLPEVAPAAGIPPRGARRLGGNATRCRTTPYRRERRDDDSPRSRFEFVTQRSSRTHPWQRETAPIPATAPASHSIPVPFFRRFAR